MKIIRTKLLPALCLTVLGTVMFLSATAQAKTTILPSPTKVRLKSCQQERLKLTWNRVKGASGYQIYRYKAGKKKYKKIATVGKKTFSWESGRTSKEQIYKIRAYKKKGKKKIYSRFSYEVSAIPYKKMAKKVNAGRVKVSRSSVSLSSFEAKKVTAQVRVTQYAKNKKAKVYDKTLRWTSTNPSIAKVDGKGNITAQGKTGTCKVYARAHNGDSDWLWVRVKAYARPKKFDDVEYMQEDMAKLIQQHEEDIKDIAEFFEKNRIEDQEEPHTILRFKLDSGRNRVVAEENLYKTDYTKVESKLYQVLDAFPGIMEIYITNYGINFRLEGDLGGEYVELIFLFYNGTVEEEDEYYFEIAPRWIYEYCPPQG